MVFIVKKSTVRMKVVISIFLLGIVALYVNAEPNREIKFPQPQKPLRPQPVPLPKPGPRPPPSPPLRIRRDVNPDVLIPQRLPLEEHAPLKVEVIQPHRHHLERPNPPLRIERGIRFPRPVPKPNRRPVPRPVPKPKPVPRPVPRPPLRLKRSLPSQFPNKPNVPKWPYEKNDNPFKFPPPSRKGPGRFRRFVDGNSVPNIPNTNNPNPSGWEINPNLSRDKNGNTNGRVDIINRGENGDFHGSWGQTLRGPNKHSETWSVGGIYHWPN